MKAISSHNIDQNPDIMLWYVIVVSVVVFVVHHHPLFFISHHPQSIIIIIIIIRSIIITITINIIFTNTFIIIYWHTYHLYSYRSLLSWAGGYPEILREGHDLLGVNKYSNSSRIRQFTDVLSLINMYDKFKALGRINIYIIVTLHERHGV